MTDPERPTSPSNEPKPKSSRSLSGWMVAAPTVALVVGLVLGAVVAGVATGDAEMAPPPEAATTPSAPASGASTAVIVPDACRQAAETVTEATNLIRDGVSAIRDFRAEEILDLLNELEDLDARAREQAELCSDAEITQLPLPSDSTSPTSESTQSAEPTPSSS